MASTRRGDKPFDLKNWSQVCPGVPGTVLWVAPMWATLCGSIASVGWSAARIGEQFVVAIIVMLLAGPIAGAMNAFALGLGVATEAQYEPHGSRGSERGKQLPYAVPASSAARWSRLLGESYERWTERLRAPTGQYIVGLASISTIALILAVLLSGLVFRVMMGAVAVAAVSCLLGHAAVERDSWLLPSSQVMLGWLLGHAAVGELHYLSVAMSALLGGTYWAILTCGGDRLALRLVLSYAFQLIGSVLLILAGLPAAAGALLLLLWPQLLFRGREWSGMAYARRVQPLIMLAMLVISMGMGSSAGG